MYTIHAYRSNASKCSGSIIVIRAQLEKTQMSELHPTHGKMNASYRPNTA